MDEQKELNKTEEKEGTTEGVGDRIQSQTEKDTLKLKAETDALNLAIAEHENTKARATLGGVTNAGQPSESKPEITPEEYAKAAIEGKILA